MKNELPFGSSLCLNLKCELYVKILKYTKSEILLFVNFYNSFRQKTYVF